MESLDKIADNIIQHEDGIWYTDKVSDISYPVSGNIECFSVEEKSFWFIHRNRCIVYAVRLYPPDGAVFDVGGGNGFVSMALAGSGFQTVVVEPGIHGALNAKKRGLKHIICSTFEDAGFKVGSVPAVGLFDVLEHVSDQRQFLGIIKEKLISGGRLYMTVPAHRILWSDEDISAGHCRRYSVRSLKNLLNACGFKVEYSSYFFSLLAPFIFLLRSVPSHLRLYKGRQIEKDHQACSTNNFFARAMEQFLKLELEYLKKNIKIPFGSSCLIVARSI